MHGHLKSRAIRTSPFCPARCNNGRFCTGGVTIMQTLMKSRWRLRWDPRALIHDCPPGTHKSTGWMEGRRPAWKHCITQMTDTAFSRRLAAYHPFTATQLQKNPSRPHTRVICFASFYWQGAKRCLGGWITPSWQWFRTMLRLLLAVYLTYMETPCRLGIWPVGFHFSDSLLPGTNNVEGSGGRKVE